MKTLLISTLAIGLIGCATQPKTVLRIVDPYSQIVYSLTDMPCPRQFSAYPQAFTYQGKVEGCYRISENNQAMYFISATDWQTRVTYTFDQLTQSKRQYESTLGYALQNVRPSYAPSVPYRSAQPGPVQPTFQCFSNGFGTVQCN